MHSSRSRLDTALDKIRRTDMANRDLLLRALSRGVGVHNSTLNNVYRQQVEELFRARNLQVPEGRLTAHLALQAHGLVCSNGEFLAQNNPGNGIFTGMLWA
jgi:hypothetical protein